jgi:hypothetical protein
MPCVHRGGSEQLEHGHASTARSRARRRFGQDQVARPGARHFVERHALRPDDAKAMISATPWGSLRVARTPCSTVALVGHGGVSTAPAPSGSVLAVLAERPGVSASEFISASGVTLEFRRSAGQGDLPPI